MINTCNARTTAATRVQPDAAFGKRSALAAAERLLADTAETVTPDTAACDLLRYAADYRAHLAMLVAAIRPAPLARAVDEAAAAVERRSDDRVPDDQR